MSGVSLEVLVGTIKNLYAENEQLRQQIAAGSTSMGQRRLNRPKLSAGDVKRMRQLKRLGATNVELATAFDVHSATVSRTIRGIYHK